MMTDLEQDKIYVAHHFASVLQWWRYIDDVFLIGIGSLQALTNFSVFFFNKMDPDITFLIVWSREAITFLDITVYIVDEHLKLIDLQNLLTEITLLS